MSYPTFPCVAFLLVVCGSIHGECAKPKAETWDVSQGTEGPVIWRMAMNGWSHGGPMILAGDRVLVGTAINDLDHAKNRAVLLCLDRATGKKLWQVEHAQLPLRINDIPGSSLQSTPTVDGNYVYYISNRGELCCVRLADGRSVWSIDMPARLGVFKRDPNDLSSLVASPTIHCDTVFCITGNGTDGSGKVPAPEAPSFLAADKLTGKVLWSSAAPGRNILYGQWSRPAIASVDGQTQVLFPGGDGLLYSYTLDGALLWKVDCRSEGEFAQRQFVVAPPLVVGEMAYVSVNRDYEQNGSSPKPIIAINLRTHQVKWTFNDEHFAGTFGPIACAGDTLYAISFTGDLVAINRLTGKLRWHSDLEVEENAISGVLHSDGKLYIANGSTVYVVAATDGHLVGQYKLDDGMSSAATPSIIEGVLYSSTSTSVYALRPPK